MDWKTCTDKKEKYQLYLQSREWAELRNKVRERANGLCERCFWNEIASVHHLTYTRVYNESLSDLQGLCNGCHSFTHGHQDEDPAKKSPLSRIARSPAIMADVCIKLFMYGMLYQRGWRFEQDLIYPACVNLTSPNGVKTSITGRPALALLFHVDGIAKADSLSKMIPDVLKDMYGIWDTPLES